jgi:hypothetical protein
MMIVLKRKIKEEEEARVMTASIGEAGELYITFKLTSPEAAAALKSVVSSSNFSTKDRNFAKFVLENDLKKK